MATPSQFMLQLTKKIQSKTDLRNIFTKESMQAIGDDMVNSIKALVLAGQSPIKGNGDFPAYKNPQKYPGLLKPPTPVNLTLTGQFLKSLRNRSNRTKLVITIYLSSPKSVLKEQGHREGAKGQPKRPIIPGDGETWHPSIIKSAQKLVNAALKQAAKTFNSR